jgi:hypothetical protein
MNFSTVVIERIFSFAETGFPPEDLPLIDHVSLGSRGFAEAIQFYSECLLPLATSLSIAPEEATSGPHGKWTFWLYPVASSEAVAAHHACTPSIKLSSVYR